MYNFSLVPLLLRAFIYFTPHVIGFGAVICTFYCWHTVKIISGYIFNYSTESREVSPFPWCLMILWGNNVGFIALSMEQIAFDAKMLF
jgi:hypothetical protein